MRTAVLLSLLLLVVLPCCDDDDNGGFRPEPIFWELTSPENVLHNLSACHKEMDSRQLAPLFHDDFHFVIWPDDIPRIPPNLHENGIWYKEGVLDALGNMLDTSYVPHKPWLKTKSIGFSITLSEDLNPPMIEGSPPGSVKGRADLDLRLDTTSGISFDIRSRPMFYFAPDSSAADSSGGVTWSIWRVEDAPYTGGNLQAPQGSGAVPLTEQSTWGVVLSLYASRSD